MGDFYEVDRFPDEFKVGSSFGLHFNVDVVSSGRNVQTVSRFQRSPYPIKKFNMNKVNLDGQMIKELQDWLYGMSGPYTGFRLKDWTDYKSTDIYSTPAFEDQIIYHVEPGEVGIDTFQLNKEYGLPGRVIKKPILKPVLGTVLVGLNGVLQEEITDYTIDNTTGIITFVVPPPGNQDITAGFEYDTPVFFEDVDIELMTFVTQTTTQSNSLRFMELLNP